MVTIPYDVRYIRYHDLQIEPDYQWYGDYIVWCTIYAQRDICTIYMYIIDVIYALRGSDSTLTVEHLVVLLSLPFLISLCWILRLAILIDIAVTSSIDENCNC